MILLRSSKSDYDHTGVEIVVANTGEDTCPVAALRALYTLDPQPPRAPLFRTHNGTLSRNKYINEMRRRLKDNGHTNYKCYSGHSPRRGAAADNGIEYDIQRLGRWSSEAFKRYFHISQAYKFHLNRRFQTGRSVPVIRPHSTSLPDRIRNSVTPTSHIHLYQLHSYGSVSIHCPRSLQSGQTLSLHLYWAQLASHLAGSARTSPVLTGPETSSEVSCNGSPSGGGYVQPRLLAVLAAPNT